MSFWPSRQDIARSYEGHVGSESKANRFYRSTAGLARAGIVMSVVAAVASISLVVWLVVERA